MRTLEEKRQRYMATMHRLLFIVPENPLIFIKEYVEALEARLPIGALPNIQHVHVGMMDARVYLIWKKEELQWVVIESPDKTWHISQAEYKSIYYSNGGNYRIPLNISPYGRGASSLHPANKVIKANWGDRFFEIVEKLKGD